MNKLKNCSGCGRLYMEIGQGMCPDCCRKEQDDEQIVYSYVRDHDKCSIKQIVDDTGVKERVVLRMLKQGRFIASGIEISYPCQSCGAPITTGKLCSKCSKDIINQVEKLKVSKDMRKVDRSSTMYNSSRGKSSN